MHHSFRKKNETILIILLLVWLVSISLELAHITPPTVDEYTFVASGYSYWKTGDFRMNTEQPPLIKLFNTIPLLFMDIKMPTEHLSWNKTQLFGNDGFYKHFVFEANKDKKEIMLFSTRAMNVVFAIALGLLTLRWVTELFGQTAGIFALALYAFEPTILAYSSLFMMEIGFSFFSTLTLYTLWSFLNKPTKKTWTLAAIAFGLVQLTKHTAIFFFGIYPAIILVYLLLSEKRLKDYFILAKCFAGMALVALLLLNATYGFQGSFQTVKQMFENDKNIDKTFYTPEKLYGNNPILKFIAENIPLPLPYQYVKGLGYVIVEAKAHRTTYLFGKISDDGFWYYYILSAVVKTPPPHLLFLMLAIITLPLNRKNLKRDMFFILPTLLFLFLFSTNNKQIGIRHLLQVYPLLIVFTSRIIQQKFLQCNIGKVFFLITAIFVAHELYAAFPDYISYTNETEGLNNGSK